MVTVFWVYILVSFSVSLFVLAFVSVVGELEGHSTPAWVLVPLAVFILGIVGSAVALGLVA